MADTAMNEKDPGHVHNEAHIHEEDNTAIKRVQNVALTHALEKQKPSLLTKRMFMV